MLIWICQNQLIRESRENFFPVVLRRMMVMKWKSEWEVTLCGMSELGWVNENHPWLIIVVPNSNRWVMPYNCIEVILPQFFKINDSPNYFTTTFLTRFSAIFHKNLSLISLARKSTSLINYLLCCEWWFYWYKKERKKKLCRMSGLSFEMMILNCYSSRRLKIEMPITEKCLRKKNFFCAAGMRNCVCVRELCKMGWVGKMKILNYSLTYVIHEAESL